MKLSTILTVALGFALAVSCSKKDDKVIEQPITVKATFAEKVGTKATVVDGGNELYWENADRIKFFYEDRSSKLECSTASTTATGSFSGTFPGQIQFYSTNIYGLYPYRDGAVVSAGTISADLTCEQTARTGGFEKDLLVCVARSTNLQMKFYNVCSGIRFSVIRSDIKSVTLEGAGGEALAGTMQIAFNSDGCPSVKSVLDPKKKITLTAPDGKFFTAGKWYYIICAPRVFLKGHKLTFDTGELYAELETVVSDTLSRNAFKSIESADRGLIFVKHGEKPGTEFEKAADVVKNMKVGWNCGNSLDSHGVACEYNTKYNCGGDKVLGFETGWHNPKIKSSLYPFVYNAGYRAIRLPVTWYPFMDNDGKVDEKWMNRVEEVVNYVLDAGLYCILDTHHDAGSKDTRWITADPASYDNVSKRFKYLWQQIGTRFGNYGPKLLFEGYNEILDANCNWDSTDADSYATANKLNQDFVDVIRGMGGKNKYRNLVVNTYSASAHEGPVKAFKMPTDVVKDHLIVAVHNYAPYKFAFDQEDPEQDVKVFTKEGEAEVKKYLKIVNDNLVAKGYPCILGEFGATKKDNDPERAKQATCYVSTAKEYGITSFVWNTLIIEADRDIPAWSAPLVKDAMINAAY